VTDAAALLGLLDRLPGRRLAVIGDLVLDRYVVGHPARISREAPVLVLEEREVFVRPGAAANPAANLAALGCAVEAIGVVGTDPDGAALLDELRSGGVGVQGVVREADVPTATKTRVLAEDPAGRRQQILRLDRIAPAMLADGTLDRLVRAIEMAATRCDALVLSDYKGGVVCEVTIRAAREAARRHARPLLVDTQGSPHRFAGFTLVKSNQPDAEAALGTALRDEATFRDGCARLLADLDLQAVVITRGGEGLSAMGADADYFHLPAVNPAEVVDVTGAGDTVIALLAAGWAAGASLRETTGLANLAASLVVRRLGVVAIPRDELRAAVRRQAGG
jgi:D-glycero-beta-D-manno-heptose-7-phosphate kinase